MIIIVLEEIDRLVPFISKKGRRTIMCEIHSCLIEKVCACLIKNGGRVFICSAWEQSKRKDSTSASLIEE
jgi:hypothetical protein